MVNRYRGEVEGELGGRHWTFVLTLGALAELEAAFACSDLNGLVAKFAEGRLSSSDLTVILGAALRGAGHDVGNEQVAAMCCPNGVAGYLSIARDVLAAAFGTAAKNEASLENP
ncbi:gene transfer agent family protein [Flexibacterium corallicola]|uniref:gene transfer agent family protein n=1 Tax=Flexibacterium corallicola TaxID=3037259 RepID=UPI00286F3F9A|nr:gene transfer agent family protein [Pseudovibrio sp. M1P-2-3]